MNLRKIWLQLGIKQSFFFFTRAVADIFITSRRVWLPLLLLLFVYFLFSSYRVDMLILFAVVNFFILMCALRPSVGLKTTAYFIERMRYLPAFGIIALPLTLGLWFVPLGTFFKTVFVWPVITFLAYYALFLLDGPMHLRYRIPSLAMTSVIIWLAVMILMTGLWHVMFSRKDMVWPMILFLVYYVFFFVFDGMTCLRYAIKHSVAMVMATKITWLVAMILITALVSGLLYAGLPLAGIYWLSIFLYACFMVNVYIQQRYKHFDYYA